MSPLSNEGLMKLSYFIAEHLKRYIKDNGYPNIMDGNVEDLIRVVDYWSEKDESQYQKVIYQRVMRDNPHL